MHAVAPVCSPKSPFSHYNALQTLAHTHTVYQAANGTSAATSSDPPPPPAPSDRTVTFADSAAPGTAAATTTSTTATSTTSGGAGGGAGAGASPSATAALPKLPLPSLEETCKNLVPAITTLLNDSEREELEKDIKVAILYVLPHVQFVVCTLTMHFVPSRLL